MRFCLVRHPVTRIVSEYAYRQKSFYRKTACDVLLRELNPWVAKYVGRLVAAENGTKFGDGGAARRKARYAIDCHLLPQHEYVLREASSDGNAQDEDPSDPGCNVVLKFERLGAAFPDLLRRTGHGPWLDRIRAKAESDERLNATTALPHRKSRRGAASCGLEAALTRESLALIHTAYARDFAAFGYTMEEDERR